MITRSGDIKNRGIAGAKTKKGSVGRLNKFFFQKMFFLFSSWVISQTTIANQNQLKKMRFKMLHPTP